MNQSLLMRVLDCIEHLQENIGDHVQVWQRVAQIAGERAAIDVGHDQVQQALFVTKLDQRKNVWVMQLRNCFCLACEAAAHLPISGIITKNDLDGHLSPKSGALTSLINSAHAPYTNAPDDVVIP